MGYRIAWPILQTLLVALGSFEIASANEPDREWFQWRGPNRDGVSHERGLLTQWPKEGPSILYQVRGLGSGMSSVAIAEQRLYTLGNIDKQTVLICRKASTGEEVWRRPFTPSKGTPNSTPTIDVSSKSVFALSNDGWLVCCHSESGEVRWKKSLPEDFQGKMESGWGYSESPLVDGKYLLCTPGGKETMVVALDKSNGELVWKGKGPEGKLKGNDGAGYASIVISEAGGTKQYVQLIGHGVVSYRADNGELLWNYDRIANGTANIPTPIIHEDFVFCSSGYGDGGTALLKIKKNDQQWTAEEIYYKPAKELQNHHGGMVMVGDYVFMGHGHNNGFPACIEWRTGKNLWEKARGPGSGSAAIVLADGKLYFRYQDAVMALIETDVSEYRLVSQFKLATKNGESWPHPVVLDGRLFIRDQDELVCYDLKSK